MIKYSKKILVTSLVTGMAFVSLTGCSMFGGGSSEGNETTAESAAATENVETTQATEAPQETEIAGLESAGAVQTDSAKFFTIESFKDGYYVIDTNRGKTSQRILVVPEGKEAPEGTGKDVVIVKQPVNSSRVDSKSLISMLETINPELLNKVNLVAMKRENVDIDSLAANMDSGVTEYSGSTNNPDVELIKSKAPDLYLANSDLLGQEEYTKLKEAGVDPVIAYYHVEEEPFGRIEWVKVLGALYGCMDEAQAFYQNQKDVMAAVDASKAADKTFIMFCINKEKNTAYVRRQDDVIAKIGSMAGGKNAMTDTKGMSWEEMTIDEFAEKFKDTDYMIYMTNHGDVAETISDLKGFSEKIGEFKAVANNGIWRTSKDYLLMNDYGDMVKELNDIFSGANTGENTVHFTHMTD